MAGIIPMFAARNKKRDAIGLYLTIVLSCRKARDQKFFPKSTPDDAEFHCLRYRLKRKAPIPHLSTRRQKARIPRPSEKIPATSCGRVTPNTGGKRRARPAQILWKRNSWKWPPGRIWAGQFADGRCRLHRPVVFADIPGRDAAHISVNCDCRARAPCGSFSARMPRVSSK